MTIQADVRNARTVLRRAFPATKFSMRIRDGSTGIMWTGDCPMQQQVENTLLETGCAEVDFRYGWRQLKNFWFYTRRPAPAREVAARQTKSRITKELRRRFPETTFNIRAHYGGATDPILFIDWLNGPQNREVETIACPLGDGVRVSVERNEPCDICGGRTIACLRARQPKASQQATYSSASIVNSSVDGRTSTAEAASHERSADEVPLSRIETTAWRLQARCQHAVLFLR